jgi:dTDP-4-dehydrorhamnose 3,5-epimerase
MHFISTDLAGLMIIDIDAIRDERGHFARTFCAADFAAAGLPTAFPQCNLSFNAVRGTLRGMHWQAEPYPEGKLVRCTRGAILDVALDLRPDSPTHGSWFAVELTAGNARSLYIPPGFAHGFQTLTDASDVFYQMTESFRSGFSRGVRWNDPAFAIHWPIANPILSQRDATYPDYAA